VLEEIAAGDGGTSTIISVNNCPVCSIAMMYANDRQKEQWLRPLAQGDMLGAFCLTEPHTGSDAAALRTTATRDGGEYVLNGVKQFITSGKYADVAIVLAVTDKAAGKKGISAFWVPTSTPGYIVAGLEQKMGQHSSDTAQILFENCRIPAENLIGEEGQGYKIALSGLEGGRIGIASQAVGSARAGEFRQADLRASGGAIPPGRHGHANRSGAATDPACGIDEGRRVAVSEGSGDGQAIRLRDGGEGLFRRHPGARRLRLRLGFPGRAHLQGRARLPDLRRHQRHPKAADRPRAVKQLRGQVGIPLRRTPRTPGVKSNIATRPHPLARKFLRAKCHKAELM
jgi:hypothetical protein